MKHSFEKYVLIILVVMLVSAYSFSQSNKLTAGETVAIKFPFGTSTGTYSKFPSALTENEWKPLETQTIHTKEGNTNIKQYLRFQGEGINGCTQVFAKDENKNSGNFLKCTNGDIIWEAQVEFGSGLTSRIEGGKLTDLDGLDFNMFGRKYSIYSTKIDTTTDIIELSLIGGAPTDKQYYLKEGETLGIGSAVVSPVVISNSEEVIFQIGGKKGYKTAPLEKAEAAVLQDGSVIGVHNILLNEAAEESGGEDIVEFSYSASKDGGGTVRFVDNYGDNTYSHGAKFIGSNSPNLQVKFIGQEISSDKFRISSIYFRLVASGNKGGDLYVPAGQTIAQNHKDTISASLIPIKYLGVSSQPKIKKDDQPRTVSGSIIAIRRQGSDEYSLGFANVQGHNYVLPLFGPSLTYGDDEGHDLIFEESESGSDYVVNQGDYVILTDENSNTGVTRVLRFNSVDITNRVVYFEDLAAGKNTAVLQDSEVEGALGEGYVIAGGNNFALVTKSDGSSIAIDTNGDGQFNGANADIVILGGGRIELDSSSLTLITESKQFDDGESDEEIEVDFSSSGSNLLATVSDQSSIDMHSVGSGGVALSIPGIDIGNGDDAGMSSYGVLVAVIDNEDVYMSYPFGARSYSVSASFNKNNNEVGQESGIIVVG